MKRSPWLVWAVGVLAYIGAVLHRTSFGVAGLQAGERFGVSASVLGGFIVLQLLVYTSLQIPAGVLLDRYGARRLIVSGALFMAAGQLVLALAGEVTTAYLGRAMVGAGDALTFISVLRLVAAWFAPHRVALATQMTGLIGQLGQVASAIPLVAVLQLDGWTVAFTGLAAVGLLIAIICAVTLHDSPDVPVTRGPSVQAYRVRRALRISFMNPGTRLGLWTHFTTQYSVTVFALMWGYPFLVSGQGQSPAVAGALLSTMVLVGIVSGPIVGVFTQRHPLRRSWLILTVVCAIVLAWTVVLMWPGRAPLWLLLVLVVVITTGGPSSMVAFDYARTFNPPNRLGTAIGVVNLGGFIASLITIMLVGVILDLRTGGAPTYSLADYKVALAVQYPIWAIGVLGILRTRRLARARSAERGMVLPPFRPAFTRHNSRRRRPNSSNDDA